MQNKIRFAMAIVFAGLAVVAAGCGSSSSDDSGSDSFRVGLEAPLSGEQSVLGQGMLKGAELAANQLNEKGGIEGKQVEIVPIDDAADPATGVKAAKTAIDAGLDGIVGPYNSGVGIETLPLYMQAGLVPIRLTSDNSTNGLGFTLQPMTYQIAPVASRGADRLAARQDGRDRLRPDPELHRLSLESTQGLAGKGGRDGDRLREGAARQEGLHRRGRKAGGEETGRRSTPPSTSPRAA